MGISRYLLPVLVIGLAVVALSAPFVEAQKPKYWEIVINDSLSWAYVGRYIYVGGDKGLWIVSYDGEITRARFDGEFYRVYSVLEVSATNE
jgi:hypothetical protein